MTSKCPLCKGTGLIWKADADGYESVTTCICQIPLKVKAYLTQCGLPESELERMTLDNFAETNDETHKMKLLASSFIENPARAFGVFGKSGTGKTHLCIALCQELVRQYCKDFKYFSYRKEIQDLQANYYDENYYASLINKWSYAGILYIDDLLKFTVNSKGEPMMRELQIIYDIINNRYLMPDKITVFSSEYSVRDILDIDAALGSRIYEMCKGYGIKTEGDNYRLRR